MSHFNLTRVAGSGHAVNRRRSDIIFAQNGQRRKRAGVADAVSSGLPNRIPELGRDQIAWGSRLTMLRQPFLAVRATGPVSYDQPMCPPCI